MVIASSRGTRSAGRHRLSAVPVVGSGNSPASAQSTVTAVGNPWMEYQGAGDGAVFFGWEDQPGATSYQVVQYDNCTGDYSSPIQVTAKQQQTTDSDGYASTWVNVTGLTDGDCYDFIANAYNSTDGTYVAASTSDTFLEPVATPAWDSATAGNGSAQLSWTSASGARRPRRCGSGQRRGRRCRSSSPGE